jgi:FAD/FMN-containing dehydrogenase
MDLDRGGGSEQTMIAKERLVEIVGGANVSDDAATLAAYSHDESFVNPIRPACVVKAHAAAEVKELVKAADETGTPLVPVSSGPPHFRGDTVPGTGGAVVVDLSGMNKIINVDRPRRVAMVEPGVTFGELITAAAKEGIRLNLPLAPKATKSVVASLLDREPVVMPKYQWDVSDPLACVEVIFGTGDDFRTGQAAGPGTVEEQWKVGGVQKAPYGPHVPAWHRLVQGAQGTMGIVTWASLRCELQPQVEEPFLVGSAQLAPLLDMAAWLIRLRIANECFILSAADLAALVSLDGEAGYAQLAADLPAYTLFYVVAGYDYFPEQRVKTYLTDITTLAMRLGVEPARAVGGLSARQVLKTVQQPSAEPYWKLRPRGACEEVFFLAVNDRVEGLVALMQDLAARAGYAPGDLGIYLQPIVQGASCHVGFDLFYDPESPKKAEQARDLSRTATKALLDAGAFFSRPYGESARDIMNRDAASLDVLKRLKKVFDPNNVMNPGKLCF